METTWAHELRRAGLRVTRPRQSVLSVLAERPHADADSIVTQARGVHPSLSPQAVYGVLRALVDNGLARRIEPAGAPRCSSCGSATTTTTWSAARAARSPMSTAPSGRLPV